MSCCRLSNDISSRILSVVGPVAVSALINLEKSIERVGCDPGSAMGSGIVLSRSLATYP